jgi:homoserine dehydrogenase
MSNVSSPRVINIGLAGLGNVGAGVFKNLEKNRALISQRIGAELRITRVAVRDLARPRDVEVPNELLTT